MYNTDATENVQQTDSNMLYMIYKLQLNMTKQYLHYYQNTENKL